MTFAELTAGLKRLNEFFGGKPYTPEQVKTAWQFSKDVSPREFDRLIEQLSMEGQRTPTIAQIFAKCQPHLKQASLHRRADEIAAMERMSKCHLCRASGLIYAVDPKNPLSEHFEIYEFVFRCPACSAAEVRNISMKIPLWENERHGHLVLVESRAMPVGKTMEDFET